MKPQRLAALLVLAAAPFAALAQAAPQETPVGLWRSIDDKTGEPKAEIRIGEKDGALTGRIVRSLRKDAQPGATCTECTDDRKGQPMVGLEIIRGGTREPNEPMWKGGRILDPENGKEYGARFTPVDAGKRLEVRGYLGPFWRTQTWQRVE